MSSRPLVTIISLMLLILPDKPLPADTAFVVRASVVSPAAFIAFSSVFTASALSAALAVSLTTLATSSLLLKICFAPRLTWYGSFKLAIMSAYFSVPLETASGTILAAIFLAPDAVAFVPLAIAPPANLSKAPSAYISVAAPRKPATASLAHIQPLVSGEYSLPMPLIPARAFFLSSSVSAKNTSVNNGLTSCCANLRDCSSRENFVSNRSNAESGLLY